MDDATVLITGATGSIGRELVRLLHDDGVPVTAMCRRPDQIAAFRRDGVRAVHGDFEDVDSLAAAMRGQQRVLLLSAPTRNQRDHGRAGVEAAARAGVEHVVHVSTLDADPGSPVPWAAASALVDSDLKASGTPWTILHPSAFMQNLLALAGAVREGRLPQTSGDGVVGWIDTRDIAAVAAHVLTTAGHERAEYVLTGPALLSMPQVADELTAVTGHAVRYQHLPSDDYRAALLAGGIDDWTADGLQQQYARIVRHGLDRVDALTTTVEDVTGHPATPLRTFLQQHRGDFTP